MDQHQKGAGRTNVSKNIFDGSFVFNEQISELFLDVLQGGIDSGEHGNLE